MGCGKNKLLAQQIQKVIYESYTHFLGNMSSNVLHNGDLIDVLSVASIFARYYDDAFHDMY
jgi:hypothetical protein